jgi:HlyD family secretion protein
VLKITIVVILTLGVTLGTIFGVVPRFRGGGAAEVTTVKVEGVSRGDLVESVAAPGEIQPLKKVQISAKVAAPITDMPFKEGDDVKKGALLVKLDDKDLKAVLRQFVAQKNAQEQQIAVAKQRIAAQRATIRASRAMLADLERDLHRNTSLVASHDVSQSVLDTAQSKFDQESEQIKATEDNVTADEINLKVMDAQLDAALAQVDKCKEDISYTTIEAPFDGTLTVLKAEVGEMVVTGTMNNAGTMILEVADLTKMLMVAHVDESQIDSIKVGQHAIVRIGAYHDQAFDGTVNTVGESRTTDTLDQTKYFEIKILLDLKGRRIRSGLSADVDIETQRQKNVLKVPSQSVMGRPVDQLPDDLKNSPELEKGKTLATVVFRLIDNKAVMTPVRVGASDDTHTIIKSGLKENEPVIVGPYKALEGLTNGQVVKLEGTKSTANRP